MYIKKRRPNTETKAGIEWKNTTLMLLDNLKVKDRWNKLYLVNWNIKKNGRILIISVNMYYKIINKVYILCMK